MACENLYGHDGGTVCAAKEFAPVKDPQDGYSFVYPFGWQEVAVKGQDVVYKDVIEPLESVSVSITQTDKADVTEFGSPAEVHSAPWPDTQTVAPRQCSLMSLC